jgi:hypothetical protein
MQSEIITCLSCGKEKELYYDENETVVAEQACDCRRNLVKIDFTILEKELKSIKETYEKHSRGIS